VISQHALALGDGSGHLALLDVEEFPIHGEWYVVHLAGKHLSVVARTFLAYLLEEAQLVANQHSLVQI
jgi:hypothetical protein